MHKICDQKVSLQVMFPSDIFTTKDILYGGSSNRRIVFVDSFLYSKKIWKEKITNYFNTFKINVVIIPIDCSEDKKDLETLMFILGHIERFNLLRRDEPIIAIGGGVLLDIVAFASSIFRRGVPYIKVPTTLLGMVDAGLGAKTSINHFGRRNRIGSYFPPITTIVDKQFLSTLDKTEITYALGEIIKIAVIKNKKLFMYLDNNLEKCLTKNFMCNEANYIISESINSMMEELVPNLWEKNLKRLVDFGHTFSPIPEMKSLEDDNVESLSHGQAVILDVLLSSKLSLSRKIISQDMYDDIVNVVKRSGLKTTHPYFEDPYILWDSLLDACKHRNGDQNLPIPNAVGSGIFVNDVSLNEIKEILNESRC